MNLKLLVRGDLRSQFGMARLLRDQTNAISPFFEEIIGVDIHYHPKFAKAKFPYEILSDDEAKNRISLDTSSLWVVFHFVTPDFYTRFSGCYNLGYLIWETNKQPSTGNWESCLKELDGLWVSAPFLIDLAKDLGWTKPIEVVPWAISRVFFDKDFSNVENLKIYRISPKRILSVRWNKVNISETGFFFSVISDAPRKALPVLLSEWVVYKKKSNYKRALLLKLSTFDCSKSEDEILKNCQEIFKNSCGGKTLSGVDFYVLTENLAENELSYFYNSCQAFVTATVGEGFGGPIAEAALFGKPVISPRHSSLEFLLPADYPLIVPHEEVTLSQGPHSFYSVSSKWGLIKAGTLSEKLIQLDLMKSNDLVRLAKSIKNFVYDVCNPKRVKLSMEKFLKNEVHVIKQICNRR